MSVVWRKWYGSGFMFLDKTQWFAESDFLANLIGKSNQFFQKKPIIEIRGWKNDSVKMVSDMFELAHIDNII